MNAVPAVALEALPAPVRDQRIIALCDTAIDRLNEARDLEEVVGLRNAAEAFAVYTRKMKAAVEAQNQCQLVVLLAEARIGAELKAAQERGEVAATAGRPKNVRATDDYSPPSHAEIGIPRQRAAEMKALAEAGEDRIRDEVKAATREGRRPTKKNIISAIPSIAQRPPELTQFVLWLRTGAGMAASLGAPQSIGARLRNCGLALNESEAEAVIDFLSDAIGDQP